MAEPLKYPQHPLWDDFVGWWRDLYPNSPEIREDNKKMWAEAWCAFRAGSKATIVHFHNDFVVLNAWNEDSDMDAVDMD